MFQQPTLLGRKLSHRTWPPTPTISESIQSHSFHPRVSVKPQGNLQQQELRHILKLIPMTTVKIQKQGRLSLVASITGRKRDTDVPQASSNPPQHHALNLIWNKAAQLYIQLWDSTETSGALQRIRSPLPFTFFYRVENWNQGNLVIEKTGIFDNKEEIQGAWVVQESWPSPTGNKRKSYFHQSAKDRSINNKFCLKNTEHIPINAQREKLSIKHHE